MKSPAHIRRGMTLVEMLVATTCTLILMGAIAQVFGAFGTAVSDSRSMIELDAQLRSVAWRLRNDLSGATARTLPPLEVEAGEGYFEVIEGPRGDADGGANASSLAPADIDDVLLFTTRNTETPYLGRYTSNPASPGTTQTNESQLAEVAWFLRPTETSTGTSPPVTTYTLFRRQNLVIGYVGFKPFYDRADGSKGANQVDWVTFNSWANFFDQFDLSTQLQTARAPDGTITSQNLFPNSLADLTRRENRFMHNIGGVIDARAGSFRFPDGTVNPTFQWQARPAPDGLIFDGNPPRTSTRAGEDVVLTNVIGFDIRVFDPGAPVGVPAGGDSAVVPGDGGFAATPVAANGAYVDLGWNKGPYGVVATSGQRPRFANLAEPMSGLRNAAGPAIWDTWSTHYESNGFDDDQDGKIDEGSNGLDDDSDGKVDESPYDVDGDGLFTGAGDDPGELETLPPYRFPLRGIEIRLRCYEPSSRQVRQVTIRHSFVPR
jgi:type II secretory pathway component PulJ